MLLNASHEITNCGLPQHILERYIRYKQGNRAIVAWMTKHGPERYKGRKTLPIKQMIALGRLLCDKAQELGGLPSDVDYYFQEVIRERSYLSQHFKVHRDKCEQDDVDTVNHEHFTESLKQIHQTLLTVKRLVRKHGNAKPTTAVKQRSRPSSPIISVSEVSNSFSQLSVTCENVDHHSNSDDEGTISDADTDATSQCSHDSLPPKECKCEGDDMLNDFLDTDGRFGTAVEVQIFLQKQERLVTLVRECWTKAGTGDVPLTAAAAYTNLVLQHAVHVVRTFHESNPEATSPLQISASFKNISHASCAPDESSNESIHTTLEALVQAETSLAKLCPDASGPGSVVDKIDSEGNLMSLIAQDLMPLADGSEQSGLTYEGLSCLAGIFDHVKHQTTSSCLLSASTTLLLLIESHGAFSSTLAAPSLIAMPRISALKLANEATASIAEFLNDKSVFPCQCVNTLGYRVAQMKQDLESFAKYKCWNTLMQSPHISGNHILEILDVCSYYGMHLFHYRHYNAAVLHCYHALVELKYLEPLCIVEEVCDLFAPVLYSTGARPVSGFTAVWLRYIGARLKFRKGKRYQDHKDTWCMAVPAHAAARSAGLNIGSKGGFTEQQAKYDYGQIDSTLKLKRNGWLLSQDAAESFEKELSGDCSLTPDLTETMHRTEDTRGAISAQVSKSKHKRRKSCHNRKSEVKCAESADCHNLLHSLSESFVNEHSSARTIAPSKLNLLALFRSITRVVSGISDATHKDDDRSSSSEAENKSQMCLCFAQTILKAADRIQEVRKMRGLDAPGATWSKNEKECIECYKDHLMKALEEADVLGGNGGKWLWSSI